jgi:outer membrane receptor protein involved in Fe transport
MRVCCGLLCVLAATDARAQTGEPDPPVAPEDAIFLDPSITGEAIEIWGERPDKPFDRDTQLRLTGEQLAERGATNLAEALELLPDLVVREQGRGGQQVEIRGARKGSVKILIDGVAVSDPYYGNFDLASIPVTDIVQIRVSSSPASPIDGVGGPGGVVEVHTRDAIGPRVLLARAAGTTLPSAEVAATGRMGLTPRLAMRASATGTLGFRDFSVTPEGGEATSLREGRQQEVGALRLEYRRGKRRAVADAWAEHATYVVPPGDDGTDDILVIDGETQLRGSILADDQLESWRLQGRAYGHYLARDSRFYADPSLEAYLRREDLVAVRYGAAGLANRPLGPRTHVIASAVLDSEEADVVGFDGASTGGRASLLEVAGGLQFADGPIGIDGSIGMAAPFGIDAAFWPEAKIATTARPLEAVAIKLTGGRKGRLPTLRERFRLDIGNQELGPEQVWFAEVESTLAPSRWWRLRLAPFFRRSNGLIRFDEGRDMLINSGTFDIRGVDGELAIAPEEMVGGGASYSFIDAVSDELGSESLDFLPQDRAILWAQLRRARYGGTVRLRYQGRQLDRGTTLPAGTLVDLSAWARLPADLTATARLDNAVDRAYEDRAGVAAPGRVLMLAIQGEWK